MGGAGKMMSLLLPLVVAIVVASMLVSPCTAGPPPTAADDAAGAGSPKPVVESVQPASAAAQDFIRARCNVSCRVRPEASRICQELLLPYATYSSYNRASLAAVTVMVSKLTAFAKDMKQYADMTSRRTVGWARASRWSTQPSAGPRIEALAKLSRLDAMGDDKAVAVATNPDLVAVMNWIEGVRKDFHKCWEGGYKNYMDDNPIA